MLTNDSGSCGTPTRSGLHCARDDDVLSVAQAPNTPVVTNVAHETKEREWPNDQIFLCQNCRIPSLYGRAKYVLNTSISKVRPTQFCSKVCGEHYCLVHAFPPVIDPEVPPGIGRATKVDLLPIGYRLACSSKGKMTITGQFATEASAIDFAKKNVTVSMVISMSRNNSCTA